MNRENFEIIAAKEEDLAGIMKMIKQVVAELNSRNLTHWHHSYPNTEIFKQDIRNNSLFILKLNGEIIGTIVLNLMKLTSIELPEYSEVAWEQKRKDKYIVISRLAVNPSYHGKGYGQKLIRFAEQYCRGKGYESLRLDTICKTLNLKNIQFYEKCGFKLLKFVYFERRKDFFVMMEKVLVGNPKL